MADTSYRDLFWQVRSSLPGVPNPVLFFNYAEAVRDFCKRSKAWQYSCPNALDLAASTAFPTLTSGTDIPELTHVVEPVRVKWADGQIIHFQTRDQLDAIDGDWEQATAAKPDYWTITSPGVFRLYPLLSSAVTEKVYLRVALAPDVNVASPRNGMPEELVNEWSPSWAAGALARLFSMPGKDWTDHKSAAAHKNEFEASILEAKSRAASDYGRPHRQTVYGGLSIGGSGRPVTDDYGR